MGREMTNDRQVLVYGANGLQGGAVVRRLLTRGREVRGLVREERGAATLRAMGVEPVFGDFSDPASLRAASEGAAAVFLVLPLQFDSETVVGWGKDAIDAAREAGVERLVFNTSTMVPRRPTDVAAFEIKRELEAYLIGSGLSHAILRPPFYAENLAAPWVSEGVLRDGVLVYPLPGDLDVSWVTANDMGALSVAALERPGLSSLILDVGGPEALDGDELAERFSRALGREVRYRQVPSQQFESGLSQVMDEQTAKGIAAIYEWVSASEDAGLCARDPDTVRKELPANLTPVSVWIAEHNGLALVPAAQEPDPHPREPEARARESITEQHRLLERWLAGTDDQTEGNFTRFAEAHGDAFTMVSAAGELLERETLLSGLRAAHGTSPGLRIETKNVRVLWREGPLLVVAFEEWHETPEAEATVRLNTVILRDEPDVKDSPNWLHLQETHRTASRLVNRRVPA